MIQIWSISDLRNACTDIENIVKKNKPVYLNKNIYGSMVVLSMEAFADLRDIVEAKLDEADYLADYTKQRVSHKNMFNKIRGHIDAK